MYLSGFADEAGGDLAAQVRATKELGWRHIEARMVGGANLTMIPDREFDKVCEALSTEGIAINCFGSGIANWSQKLSSSPEPSYEEMRRAIPRMQRLGVKFIRIMSFTLDKPCPLSDAAAAAEAIGRMRTLVRMAEEGGVVCVHENCSGWAGQSWEHTLRLFDEIESPALRLVFDTGNPVAEKDVRGAPPYRYQDPLEFYRKVREHIVHVHIKDERMVDGRTVYTFPGEGDGRVREILSELMHSRYDACLTIEPHMTAVAHDPSVVSEAQAKYDTYVEYGRRLAALLDEIGWSARS